MLNQRFVNVIYFIIFLIISVYTVFKISPVLSGPEILINKSTLITNKDTRLHNISGTVLRASEIRVFDAILNTDKNGN
ncbi:MAG: hypothetical protein QM532_01765 [Cyanobium sp. MAG06]|nr:hypothetical protein [Cyanobium sp. MAG06]